MAKFQLNPGVQAPAQQQQPERVGVGSVSLFALIVIICLAVLAVLAFSTANATLTMSQRQATATAELYLDETAAQEFVGGIDAILAKTRTEDAAQNDDAPVAFARNKWGNVAYDENGLVIVLEGDDASAAAVPAETPAAKASAAAAPKEAPAAEASAAAAAPAAAVPTTAAAKAVGAALPELCATAQESTNNQVKAVAEIFGNRIRADFSCENGRLLTIVVTIRENGTYRIDKWKMSAVQNEEQPEGQFWISD